MSTTSPQTAGDNFFPPDYERPKTGGNYMKFKDGENRFRILAKPIFGTVGWMQDGQTRRPVRKQMGEEFAVGEVIVDAKNKIRHFWAMPVWNYGEQAIQILEITQSTIQEAIEALAKNAKWGSPLNYDICVKRSGEGMDTEYTVMPEPKTPLDPEIVPLWESTAARFNLNALFTNGDPFDTAPDGAPNGVAPSTVPGSATTPEGREMKRFFATLDELVGLGIYDKAIRGRSAEGQVMRRKLLADLGFAKEPHQMSAEEWASATSKLDLIKAKNTPPGDTDDDIPF